MSLKLVLNQTLNTITVDKDENIDITANNDAELIIMIQGGNKLNINGSFYKGVVKIVIINVSDQDIVINENYINDGAYTTVAYAMLSKGNIILNSYSDVLKGELNYHNYVLAVNTLEIIEKVVNCKPNTTANIYNNVVALDNSNFSLNAIGKINKNSYKSASHQLSSCLTFGDIDTLKVLPILEIDENDVLASHSNDIGTINENQKFYLHSRGLSDSQISELITIGYIMPFTKIIESDDITNLVKDKVKELCKN